MEGSWESPAKINLFLRVFEKRPDGYHRIESAFVKLDLADDVFLAVGDGFGIGCSVPGRPELDGETNLAARAARAYLDGCNLGRRVDIRIIKRIPVAGGLGGGSSNAAAVLRGLNDLLGSAGGEQLRRMAEGLGGDVPFFVQPANAALVRGRGEEIAGWTSLPPRTVLLVNPGVPVSTREAYAGLGRTLTWRAPDDNRGSLSAEPRNWSDLERLLEVGNDFEAVVERGCPAIAEIRKELRAAGAALSRMSGSGGTVFGLFDDDAAAERARDLFSKRWPTWLTRTRG